PQSSQNGGWPNISLSSYNSKVIDGNYGQSGGTGAKKLQLPFVGGGVKPFEIIRRPPAGESPTGAIGASREYNMAQIRVLLVDDPSELPGGAGDANNVRLANITDPANRTNPYGISTPVGAGLGLPALPAGSNYNMYFAAGSAAIPDWTSCNNAACGTANAKT